MALGMVSWFWGWEDGFLDGWMTMGWVNCFLGWKNGFWDEWVV